MLREYGLAYRLGSRTQHTGSETIYDESSYLGGDMRTPIIVRTAIANGVSFPDAKLVIIGANDLSDDADVAARPVPTRSKSKTAAFVSDFRDLSRPVRRKSHYPAMIALLNALNKLQQASEEVNTKSEYLHQQLQEIREHAERERSHRI